MRLIAAFMNKGSRSLLPRDRESRRFNGKLGETTVSRADSRVWITGTIDGTYPGQSGLEAFGAAL